MPTLRTLLTCCVLLAVALPAGEALAQRVDLDAYEPVDVEDLAPAYRHWLQEEVSVIITDLERDVFLRLSDDARRDAFIERFWAVRDPSPGTARNEYRELHYQRLQHVNEEFGRTSTRPGWQTDRGRVYLLLGKPQSVNRLPNTTQAVPIEIWFYSVDPAYGTPPFFYLIFFRDRGVGDYRLYSPAIDGPDKLLNASGRAELGRGGRSGAGQFSLAGGGNQAIEALRRIDPELGNAAASLVPGDAAGGVVSPLRSEMVLSRVFEIPTRLMPRPAWALRVLAGETESSVRFATLPMQAAAHVLFDPSGLPFVHFAARSQGDDLNLNNYEDRYYVTFEVASTLRDPQLRVIEDRPARTLQADLDEETARRLRGGPVEYLERMPTLPGEYALDLTLENNLTRRFARTTLDLRVPQLAGDQVDAAAPVLVLDTTMIEGDYEPFAQQVPYQVGKRLLVPAVAGGPFPTGGEAGLFWQLYVPDVRRAPLELIYQVVDTSGAVLVERRERLAVERRDPHRLLEAYSSLDLQGFTPGDYTIIARVAGVEALRYRLPLTVAAADSAPRPFVHAARTPPAEGVEVAVERARQLRTVGRTDAAIEILDGVLRRDPDDRDAFALQVDLLTDAGRTTALDALITPRLVQTPNDPELLLQMGSIKAQLGAHYDAIRFYERAVLAGAEADPELLNAMASEYYAQGDIERARALLERSLELDSSQEPIRRLLQRVLGSR